MKILTLPVGQMQSNCYVAIDETTKKAVVIDPGDDAEFIMHRIHDEQAYPIYLLATHGHFDHIMAATELKLVYTIPFLIHKNDLSILARHKKTAEYFLGIDVPPPPPPDGFLTHGMQLHVGKSSLTVIETPGHTQGSICLYDGNDTIFTGDTLFAYGNVGRTDLEGGDREQLYNSIKHRIMKLPPQTIVLPGHGEDTSIRKEWQFFRD